ncbi:hypothetical protein [Tsukamurella ocularis]|uniref:hypothetical protein n=1 Tax=Tsukamurella ocularis TaxID=1970234 RepID=UPI002167925C|nr:hypothetical protein [Tsukamurella ocularis]MCS3779545.1 hypothetical protein [Tsukamurella ocularis]MCS3787982.1 hypothetical protein [Tsukamurella ocularis]MCS3852298.1 hypothetical protein [Tsukamurella ocularis]
MTSSFSQFPLDDLLDASSSLRVVSASLSAPARPSVAGAGSEAGAAVNAAMAGHAEVGGVFTQQLIANIAEFGRAADGIAARASASDIAGKALFNRVQA